jgi:hypothetical protein
MYPLKHCGKKKRRIALRFSTISSRLFGHTGDKNGGAGRFTPRVRTR